MLAAKDVFAVGSRRRVAPAERVRPPMLKNTEPLPVPAASVRTLLAEAKLMPARVCVLTVVSRPWTRSGVPLSVSVLVGARMLSIGAKA